jgi:hypothetical protein
MVDQVYGVNETEDWTVYASGYGHHTWAKSELNRAIKYFPNYDGFGLPLHIATSTRGKQNGKKTLPETVYVYWASLAEGKFYVSKFDLTADMREAMMMDDPETLSNGNISHCYQKNVVFGLLPGGTAKVWSLGCDKYTYLGKIEAAKVFDSYPSNVIYFEAMQKKTEKRAADNGVELFPIPYDKVDQVFHYDLQKRRCAINREFWGCD